MKKFLLFQIRPEDAASDNELESFMKFGGLSDEEVRRVRLDQGGVPDDINLDEFAGLIIGGGPWDISKDEDEKSGMQKKSEQDFVTFLQEVVDRDFPTLAACYGFGAFVKHQGGVESYNDYAEGVKAVDITLKDEANSDPLLQGLPKTFRAMGGHKEACEKLPPNAVWLASSETCPYHMFRIKENIYATQFHPELETEGLCLRIDIYKNAGYFPPEEAEVLKEAGRKETITVPMMILKRFVDRYRQ